MKRFLIRFALVAAAVAVCLPDIGHAYVWGGYKWANRQVPYYVNPTNMDVSQSAALAAVQYGAATWTQQSNADFAFYYMGQTSGNSFTNNGKNEVFFRNGSNGGMVAETMRWFDGSGNLLDADIAFYDAAWTFFTGSSGCIGGVYVEDFAAHEFGHALGLKHSTVTTATMYPTGTNCSISWRTLDADDLAGIESIYPATGTSNTAPTVTISAPANGATVAYGATVTFIGYATDSQDGDITSRLSWSSSLDGALGTGGSVSKLLSVGTHTVRASATDSKGLTTTSSETVTVTSAPAVQTTASALALTARSYKVKNQKRVDLGWSGGGMTTVDVYRNNVRVTTTGNDGAYTDSLGNKSSGTFTYKVCETGTTTCSNEASVVF
jgi:hypothetical protein